MNELVAKNRVWHKVGTQLVLYFLDYKTHQTIRHTQVLEEENRKKPAPPLQPLPPHPAKRARYSTFGL